MIQRKYRKLIISRDWSIDNPIKNVVTSYKITWEANARLWGDSAKKKKQWSVLQSEAGCGVPIRGVLNQDKHRPAGNG